MTIQWGKGAKPIKLTPKKICWSNFNLLVELTGKKRSAIIQRFHVHCKDGFNYSHVSEYIKMILNKKK